MRVDKKRRCSSFGTLCQRSKARQQSQKEKQGNIHRNEKLRFTRQVETQTSKLLLILDKVFEDRFGLLKL